MEGREHAEFELKVVARWWSERGPVGKIPFGDFDGIVNVVLDAVDTRVDIKIRKDDVFALACGILLGAFVQIMPDNAYFQHTQFFKCPF